MRTEVRTTPPPDDSEHVIRWVERDGMPHEERVEGGAAASALWNSLHEATTDGARRVNSMMWHELVRVVDEDGAEVGVEEVSRGIFSHGFEALGVYPEDAELEED